MKKHLCVRSALPGLVSHSLKIKRFGLTSVKFACAILALTFSVAMPLHAQSESEPSTPLRDRVGDYVLDWRSADKDWEDTEFGDKLYSEPSTESKLELLTLLGKDTPSMLVFIQALSMGVDLEEVLQAATHFNADGRREYAASAVQLLPLLDKQEPYLYSGYELEDLERDDDTEPYRVQEVVDRFFKDRLVLRPYPDWFAGQYHFLASAAELKALQAPNSKVRWYQAESSQDTTIRPIFVSLYEANESILIDGEERINTAYAENPDALLPVVFIFNRMSERSVDELGYDKTLTGVQKAYTEQGLMVTPTPQWKVGEHHFYAEMKEIYEIFEIPEQDDFEPEVWDQLVQRAELYQREPFAFPIVVLSNDENEGQASRRQPVSEFFSLAAYDDPRSESSMKYTTGSSSNSDANGDSDQQKESESDYYASVVGQGMILTRPDLIAALNSLGVESVRVAIYYLDSARVKPYRRGAAALINWVNGITPRPPRPTGSGGFTPCASPPCLGN